MWPTKLGTTARSTRPTGPPVPGAWWTTEPRRDAAATLTPLCARADLRLRLSFLRRCYPFLVSPTVMRVGGLRFYFFSREEPRQHIHVEGPTGEAKVWLEPAIAIAENHGLGTRDLNVALRAIKEHEDEIRAAWQAHFGR